MPDYFMSLVYDKGFAQALLASCVFALAAKFGWPYVSRAWTQLWDWAASLNKRFSKWRARTILSSLAHDCRAVSDVAYLVSSSQSATASLLMYSVFVNTTFIPLAVLPRERLGNFFRYYLPIISIYLVLGFVYLGFRTILSATARKRLLWDPEDYQQAQFLRAKKLYLTSGMGIDEIDALFLSVRAHVQFKAKPEDQNAPKDGSHSCQ